LAKTELFKNNNLITFNFGRIRKTILSYTTSFEQSCDSNNVDDNFNSPHFIPNIHNREDLSVGTICMETLQTYHGQQTGGG